MIERNMSSKRKEKNAPMLKSIICNMECRKKECCKQHQWRKVVCKKKTLATCETYYRCQMCKRILQMTHRSEICALLEYISHWSNFANTFVFNIFSLRDGIWVPSRSFLATLIFATSTVFSFHTTSLIKRSSVWPLCNTTCNLSFIYWTHKGTQLNF